jgi:hypothetical protein
MEAVVLQGMLQLQEKGISACYNGSKKTFNWNMWCLTDSMHYLLPKQVRCGQARDDASWSLALGSFLQHERIDKTLDGGNVRTQQKLL